jgi:GTP-binding protein
MTTEKSTATPVVAIVGRPNVGKSTLFNRLVGKRLAIVEDVAGVTRDRHYASANWEGRRFTVVDTGGFWTDTEDVLLNRVRDQAQLAIDEAQTVILVVDGEAGLTSGDQEIARLLRKSGKPTFLAVNKVDSARREQEGFVTEFYRLGLQNVFGVSAEHGRGVGDLMEELVKTLPEVPEEEEVEEDVCRIAIVGRPNVGKSTLINKLLGEERFVASEVPGTTTDPVDARLEHQGQKYVLTDTAGIRRKRSIALKVEQFSVIRAFNAMDKADVVLLLLDATEPAVEQDAKIAGLAVEKGKALVVLVNKWDKLPATKAEEFRKELEYKMPFIGWAPMIFGSALTGTKVFQALQKCGEAFQQYQARVPTPLVNKFMQHIEDEHPAPRGPGGFPARIYYIAQIGVRPPMFALSTNRPEGITDDYKRFIVNRMRAAFGLNVPIRLIFKRKTKKQFVPKKEPRR